MSTVAQTVLDKSRLQLKGAVLKVFPLVEKEESPDNPHGLDESDSQGDTRRQDMSRTQGGTHGQESSKTRTTQKDWDIRTIEVTGHKATTSGDAIVLLFESKLPNDEDPITHLQRHPDKDVIYVTFTTAEG